MVSYFQFIVLICMLYLHFHSSLISQVHILQFTNSISFPYNLFGTFLKQDLENVTERVIANTVPKNAANLIIKTTITYVLSLFLMLSKMALDMNPTCPKKRSKPQHSYFVYEMISDNMVEHDRNKSGRST